MTTLTSAIETVCNDATDSIIGKVAPKRGKWIRTATGTILTETFDYSSLVVRSISDESFKARESYRALVEHLTNDPPYSTATTKIGYWGQPHALFQRLLVDSLIITNGQPKISPEIAITLFGRVEDFLVASEIIYEAKARILGVKLATPNVPITANIALVKMTDDEVNTMQPFIDEYPSLSGNFLDHDTELRSELRIPVDSNKELPLLSNSNSASNQWTGVCREIISALRLYKSGLIELGPRSVSSFLIPTGSARSIYALPIMSSEMEIGISDIKPLQNSHRIIADGRSNDRVLDRALHRFLLARQRHDFSDRLVDLVIAWESLLLTVNKNAIRDELSYRFGINGSSVLFHSGAELNRHTGRKAMSAAYSVRSLIVHGATSEAVESELLKNDFDCIASLVADMEEKLRRVVLWISTLDIQARPYTKPGGWELLLWNEIT